MASYQRLLGFMLLALAGWPRPCAALSDVRVSVPAHVLRGRSARLSCHYQLDGERLYSVKWYKGRHEFYRYTPSEQPFKKAFPPLGNHVDLKQSSGTHVALVNADDSLTGRYSCEVSADAPSFLTFLVSDEMVVVDAPRERPHLSGVRSHYRPGDLLNATCTAGPSHPPATLTFIVNDVQQDERSVREQLPLQEGSSGLARSRLSLVLPVTASLAPRARVLCVASIGAVYWQRVERSPFVTVPGQGHHEGAGAVAGSGDWPDSGADSEDDEDEPEEQSEQRQHRGHHRHSVQAVATTAPADVRHEGEVSAASGVRQLSRGWWWALVVTALHLQLYLHLQLSLAAA